MQKFNIGILILIDTRIDRDAAPTLLGSGEGTFLSKAAM